MQPDQLRKLVRKWTVPVLGLVLVGAIAAYVVSKSLTPIYQATGTVLVLGGPQQANPASSANSSADQVTATAAQLLQEPPLLQTVIDDLHLNETPLTLGKALTVTPETSTSLVDVAASDPNPQRAAQIANALMSDFVNEIQASNQQYIRQAGSALQAQISQVESALSTEQAQLAAAKAGTSTSTLTTAISANQALLAQLNVSLGTVESTAAQTQETVSVAAPASAPTLPTSPNTKVNTALGGIAGLLVGLGLAALVEFLDQGLRDADEVRRRLGIPCLAVIPRFDPASHTARGRRATDAATEAYRRLRTNLLFAQPDDPIRSVVVTSVRTGEGKTRTAANLAVAMANAEKRTLLVDADMRRPSLHRLFRASLTEGLSDMILSRATATRPSLNGSHATEHPGLSLVSCGTIPPNPAELLASRRSAALLSGFERDHDLVVVDTPPADAMTDALSVAVHTSGTILVVEAGKTSAAQVSEVINALHGVGAKVIGVVINKATGRILSRYYYYTAAADAQPPKRRILGMRRGGAPGPVADDVSETSAAGT